MPTRILSSGAARAWLRRFGAPTRRVDWPSAQPAVQGVRVSAPSEELDLMGLEVAQTAEVLVVQRGALGADAGEGTLVEHDGALVQLSHGPIRLDTDRAWDVWLLVTDGP